VHAHWMKMNVQKLIKRTLSIPENIEYVYQLLAGNQYSHRTEFARVVCEHFEFFDTRGENQLGGCLKALRKLEAVGRFVLPVTHYIRGPQSPQRLSEPLAIPKDVPAQAGDVCGLTVVLVKTDGQMRIWNEMMITDHPQGAGPLVGRQLRYLIGSEHGWLGGFGFAAAALQLADRDKWIGWNVEQRQLHLHGIVGMSRFLLRQSVQCRNLASKVLSMAMAALPVDFEQKYNYRPWLVESFVDTSQYSGTCYQAANWIHVGQTKGRGRQDRFSKSALSKKSIYVFQIDRDFRKGSRKNKCRVLRVEAQF